jgi:hypothetical protein
MQKSFINAEKFIKVPLMQKNSQKFHYCKKIPLIQKNSIDAEKFHYCRKIPLMQKNSMNAGKCKKIPLMQKNSIHSKKFHHSGLLLPLDYIYTVALHGRHGF